MKVIQLLECAAKVRDFDTIVVTGNGGGVLEPDEVFSALEQSFLTTGHPRDLTVIHSLGIGDCAERGINRFAHKGMVRRVIGGHWSWSPRMQALARNNDIEAFALPSGVIALLMREVGARRPGLITGVGLGTCYDPRNGGGAANAAAQSAKPLSEILVIDGQEYIRYLPIEPDVAIVRGTYCDEFGNISCAEEAGDLDANALALAASSSGGTVLAQVREQRRSKDNYSRLVQIPGVLVDFVILAPNQPQTHAGGYEASLAGLPGASAPDPDLFDGMSSPTGMRAIIARRAADEIRPRQSVNFGFGIPGGIAAVLAQSDQLKDIWVTLEQGVHNGQLIDGALFGAAINPSAIMRSTDQFDFYSGGGADIAFLGAGEVDKAGNVNVSKLGDDVVGPGGFVDISQGAKAIVFCSTFETAGLKTKVMEGNLVIDVPGRIKKFVDKVREVTFSGAEAAALGKSVLYVTERAVFRLTVDGLELIEIAPGIDVQADVLDRMAFQPRVAKNISIMPAHCFLAGA